MNDHQPSRSPLIRLISAAMAPMFLLGSVFNALPALAQVEIAPRAAILGGAGLVRRPSRPRRDGRRSGPSRSRRAFRARDRLSRGRFRRALDPSRRRSVGYRRSRPRRPPPRLPPLRPLFPPPLRPLTPAASVPADNGAPASGSGSGRRAVFRRRANTRHSGRDREGVRRLHPGLRGSARSAGVVAERQPRSSTARRSAGNAPRAAIDSLAAESPPRRPAALDGLRALDGPVPAQDSPCRARRRRAR